MVSDPSTEPVPEGAGPTPTPAEPGAGHGEDRLPAETEQPELPSPFLDSAFRRQTTGEPTQEPEPVDGASPVDSEPVHRASDATDPGAAEPDAEEPTARRTVSKKRGRASVPSWDEIMFGGSDQD